MLFLPLLLATGLLWVNLRYKDPGYITRPSTVKSGGSSSGGGGGGGGGGGSGGGGGGSGSSAAETPVLAREIMPTLPAQFGVLTRHYADSLRVVPRAYVVAVAVGAVVLVVVVGVY
jgi:hypothetical protein